MARSRILLVSRDLMFSSPIMGDAKRQGFELVVEANAERASQRAVEESWFRVILDLSHPQIDPSAFADCSASVIAVGPHVHRAKLEQAREAGCAMVLTNGQFAANRSEIFAQLASEED
ncbi:hypothetical protein [Thalassoroseus pseudoceratinae]|uniref:hypothetical protein n=1 Tax=Thalassoroseus pseudoceratinae TaxID=2713176 RepID=UPI00141D7F0B|nr:hypothetical protein [Thalassoroseus pseudoceratinae]